MDFASGLLARLSQNTKAAQEAARKRAAADLDARRRAADAKAAAEKAIVRQEADKMLRRLAPSSRVPTKPRRRPPPRASPTTTTAQNRPPPRRPPPRRAVPPPRPSGPPKPLPGMEFVVRREKKREIRVPHTSDYSDLFGDDYLVGIDLKCVRDMQAESAEATKEARQIIAERREKAQRLLREAQLAQQKEQELQERGLKPKDPNARRRKAAENDWVAVAVPPSALPPGQRPTVVKSPLPGSRGPAFPATKRDKARELELTRSKVQERSRALKERIMAATGGAPSRKTSPPRRDLLEPEVINSKRKRAERSKDRSPYDEPRRAVKRSRHEERDRHDTYSRGYNSEEWSDGDDGDDDDDDDEDLFGIEALEREEARSTRLAALEDKRERLKEAQRKKEKERRRLEYERHRD